MTTDADDGAALSAEDEDAIRLALAARPRPRNHPINYPHAAALLLAEIDQLRAQLAAQQAENDRLRTALDDSTRQWFYRTHGWQIDDHTPRGWNGWREDAEVQRILRHRALLSGAEEASGGN